MTVKGTNAKGNLKRQELALRSIIIIWSMTFNNTLKKETQFPCTTNLYLFKDNNRNTRKGCEIYSKLTVKTPEQRQ